MSFSIENVKLLHVESSTKCNAWCPGCDRNMHGYGLAKDLIQEDLSADRFDELLNELPNLEIIQFCGNLGDPIAGKNFLKLLDIAVSTGAKIQIHTNGGLRSKKWWADLGCNLKNYNHDIWFGIDGLKDVHEIYRQGTKYEKVIENATSFIKNGGHSTWQFIPFAHNEHQMKDCIRESQKLGFKKFKVVPTFREIDVAYNYKTGQSFTLSSPIALKKLIKFYHKTTLTEASVLENLKHKEKQVRLENCMHLSLPSIFLNANGKLSHCCYKSKELFDTIEELVYNKVDLQEQTCLNTCGTLN